MTTRAHLKLGGTVDTGECICIAIAGSADASPVDLIVIGRAATGCIEREGEEAKPD